MDHFVSAFHSRHLTEKLSRANRLSTATPSMPSSQTMPVVDLLEITYCSRN